MVELFGLQKGRPLFGSSSGRGEGDCARLGTEAPYKRKGMVQNFGEVTGLGRGKC